MSENRAQFMKLQMIKQLFLIIMTVFITSCASVVVKDDGLGRNEKASNINVQLGIGYMQQNNLEVASQKLNRALIQNPESSPAHNAFAILQDRLLQFDLAEKHYKLGAELDVKNSQANNNYGVFLCRRGRQLESEKYFLIALKQPLYRTPEVAYTNAGACLIQINEFEKAEGYLKKALAARSNYSSALIQLADIYFKQEKYTDSLLYLKRLNLVKNTTPKSLWLEARNYLALDNVKKATDKIDLLKQKFPESKEYLEWKSINK